jgi:ferrous iron transport protein A
MNSLEHEDAGAMLRVTAVAGTGAVRNRLLQMGVTPGTTISVVRKAPLGDPIEIEVRGYYLSLRRAEARLISVEGGI